MWWHVSTMEDFRKSMVELKRQCKRLDINKLAMAAPTDIDWSVAKNLISEIFQDTPITITLFLGK